MGITGSMGLQVDEYPATETSPPRYPLCMVAAVVGAQLHRQCGRNLLALCGGHPACIILLLLCSAVFFSLGAGYQVLAGRGFQLKYSPTRTARSSNPTNNHPYEYSTLA